MCGGQTKVLIRMAINETLQEQVQQTLGLRNTAQLDEFLAGVAEMAMLPGCSPVARNARIAEFAQAS